MQAHQLEAIPGGQRCAVCKWHWRLYPTSLCPGVERFAYAQVPPSMKTYTQLRVQGLKPADRARPDGCYYAVHKRDWLWFYDERQAIPRRKATPAQMQALARAKKAFIAKYTCLGCGKKPQTPHDRKDLVCGYCSACRWEAEKQALAAQIEMDGEVACAWAAGLLQREDWAIVDLETTSLSGAIVEIAVVDREGNTLLHSLVNPQMPITEEARAVHGIGDNEVAHAPTLPEVWDAFMQALEGRSILVTYNTEFDKGILESEARRYGLIRSQQTWHCLMRKYAKYVGDWSDYWHDYRWYPLPDGNHRAVGDALAALALLQRMAAYATETLESEQEAEKEGGTA
jgi:DNA polymerase III epsilon subunit-like protein